MESLIFEKFYNIKTVETQTQKRESCFAFHGYGLYRNKQMNRHSRQKKPRRNFQEINVSLDFFI